MRDHSQSVVIDTQKTLSHFKFRHQHHTFQFNPFFFLSLSLSLSLFSLFFSTPFRSFIITSFSSLTPSFLPSHRYMDPTNDTTATISSSTTAHSITPPMSPTSSPITTASIESDLLAKKKQHHFSHISADSTTTTDDDDLDLDLHRRSTSGSDSIYSSVTESTEPPQKESSPEPSKMSSIDTETEINITSSLPIQRGEQLDPWGSNPYDQEDLASTLRFSRNPDDLDDDHAEEEHDTVPGLARITTTSSAAITRSILSPTGGRPSLTLSTTEDDSLERLDKEFERLTSGQSIQIMHTASSPLALDFDREQLDDPRGIVERSIPDNDKRIKLSKLFSRAASNGDMNRVADMLDNFRDWIDIEAQDEDGTTPLIYAACFGHVEIAFMLLEAGALVDARDKCKWNYVRIPDTPNQKKKQSDDSFVLYLSLSFFCNMSMSCPHILTFLLAVTLTHTHTLVDV